jgi:hypothetical protein
MARVEDGTTGGPGYFSTDPVWAPHGRRILFVHTQIVDGAFSCNLLTIAPNGAARQVVANTPECEDEPDWESIL